jgi:hypothetical protein
MGDLHYGDSTSTDEAVRQALYDDVLALSKPGQLFREVPCPYIYDDHDFCGNNSDSTSTGATAAKAAFRARVPVPVASSSGNPNYYSFAYGRVRFIVTDLRSARSPVVQDDDGDHAKDVVQGRAGRGGGSESGHRVGQHRALAGNDGQQ